MKLRMTLMDADVRVHFVFVTRADPRHPRFNFDFWPIDPRRRVRGYLRSLAADLRRFTPRMWISLAYR